MTSIGKRVKSLVADVGMYGVSTVAGQLIAVFLLPIYTRVFTTEEYGVIALLGLISLALPPMASVGMPSVVMRFLPFCKTDRERHELVGMTFAVALLAALVLVGAGFFILRPLSVLLVDDPRHANLVGLVLLTSGLAAVSDVPYTVLRSERRTKLVAVTQLTGGIGGAVLSIYMVVVLKKGLWGYFVAGLAAQAFAAVGKVWLVRKGIKFRYDASELRRVLTYGAPIVPHRILGLGMVVWARYAIKYHLSLADAGLYAVAAKVARPLDRIVSMFQLAWTPFKLEETAKNSDAKELFRNVLSGYAALLFFFWLGVSLFGSVALRLLTTEPYWKSGDLIPAIALIPLAVAASWMMATGLELGFNMARLPLVTLIAAAACIGSSQLLIPWLGAEGAALSIALGHLMFAVVVFYFSQKAYPIRYDWGKILALCAAAVVIVVAVQRVNHNPLSVVGIGLRLSGLLVYAGTALWLTGRVVTQTTLRRGLKRVLG